MCFRLRRATSPSQRNGGGIITFGVIFESNHGGIVAEITPLVVPSLRATPGPFYQN
jgi:hypothetical protein